MTERFLTIQARRDNKSTTVPKKEHGFQKHIEKIKFKDREREGGRGGGMIMARHSRDHKSTFTQRRI